MVWSAERLRRPYSVVTRARAQVVEILGLTLAHGVFSGFLWWMQFGVGVCGLLTVWAGLSFFLAMKNRGDEEKEAAKLGHVSRCVYLSLITVPVAAMLAIVCFTAARSAFLLSYIRIEDADAEADVEAFGLRRALQVISASSASRSCEL